MQVKVGAASEPGPVTTETATKFRHAESFGSQDLGKVKHPLDWKQDFKKEQGGAWKAFYQQALAKDKRQIWRGAAPPAGGRGDFYV